MFLMQVSGFSNANLPQSAYNEERNQQLSAKKDRGEGTCQFQLASYGVTIHYVLIVAMVYVHPKISPTEAPLPSSRPSFLMECPCPFPARAALAGPIATGGNPARCGAIGRDR